MKLLKSSYEESLGRYWVTDKLLAVLCQQTLTCSWQPAGRRQRYLYLCRLMPPCRKTHWAFGLTKCSTCPVWNHWMKITKGMYRYLPNGTRGLVDSGWVRVRSRSILCLSGEGHHGLGGCHSRVTHVTCPVMVEMVLSSEWAICWVGESLLTYRKCNIRQQSDLLFVCEHDYKQGEQVLSYLWTSCVALIYTIWKDLSWAAPAVTIHSFLQGKVVPGM